MAKAAAAQKVIPCEWCKGVGYFPNKKTAIGSGVKVKTNCHNCQGKGSYPAFTEEDKKNFQQACRATWNSIAGDMPDADNMPHSHVVEVVLDADHMDHYGCGSYLKGEERKAFILRMRQVRYSNIATRWAREVL